MEPIIIQSFPNLRTCTIGVVTNWGAAYDKLGGTTQLLVQTMTRGTKKENEASIAKKIDGRGGSLFSIIEKDFSVIGAQIRPKYAESTLELLFDMITEPSLEEQHFQIEKQNLIQIWNRINANALQRLLFFEADRAIFGQDHPFSRPQIGSLDSLNTITKEDLHTLQKDFLVKPWGFAIGFIPSEVKNKLHQSFTDFFNNHSSRQNVNSIKPYNTIQKNFVSSPSTNDENVYLCLNICLKADPNEVGFLKFSSGLLGESFGSRMFSILRDKYSFGYIAGSTLKLLSDRFILRCYMETSPKRATEAISSLLDLINDLGQKKISEEEYKTTRDFLLGNLDLSFDDARTVSSKIINRRVHDLSPDIDDGYKEVNSVNREKLHLWWKKILRPENFSLSLSGNFDANGALEKWQQQEIGHMEDK
ncbi:MAG: M16 family metallopeptidase [Candidatus Hodarchaeales archaeon]